MARCISYEKFLESIAKYLDTLTEPKVTYFPKGMIQRQETEIILDIGEMLDESNCRFAIFPSGEIKLPNQIGKFDVTDLPKNKYKFTLIEEKQPIKIQFGEDREWKI
jgi:hypothetical protein